MAKAIFFTLLLALFAAALAQVDMELDTSARTEVIRGACAGRGRAAKLCRRIEDDWETCKIVGCKRGRRRGFRCTCRRPDSD